MPTSPCNFTDLRAIGSTKTALQTHAGPFSQNRLLLSLTPSSAVMNHCCRTRAAGSSAEALLAPARRRIFETQPAAASWQQAAAGSRLQIFRRLKNRIAYPLGRLMADREIFRMFADMEKNAPYVVQRVLEYGRLSDWKLLLSYYGLCRIADIACHLRTLEPRALSFISTVSGVPKNQFRCFIMKP